MNIFRLKINAVAASFAVVLIALSLSGCNDKPTALGYSLISDTVSLTPITSDKVPLIKSAVSLPDNIELVNKGALLVGSYKDFKAVSFLRFGGIPDTLNYLKASDIVSARLTLTPLKYTFGDTLQNKLAFNVYKVTRQWSKFTSWDSLFKGGMGSSDYIDLQNSQGSYSTQIPIKDTVSDVVVDIKPDVLIDWFQQRNDSTRHGIALVPDESSSNVIRKFSSQAINVNNAVPTLKIVYRNKSQKLDSLTVSSAMDDFFTTAPKPGEDEIVIEGGIIYRGRMLFDVTSIPKLAGIHKAELVMTLDPSKSMFGTTPADSVIRVDLMQDSTFNNVPLQTYYGSRTYGTNTYVFPNLISAIEWWTRRGGSGYLSFSPEGLNDELLEVDRLVFYGLNNPDPAKRPKLRIIYSIQSRK